MAASSDSSAEIILFRARSVKMFFAAPQEQDKKASFPLPMLLTGTLLIVLLISASLLPQLQDMALLTGQSLPRP